MSASRKPHCEPVVIEREVLLVLILKAAAYDRRMHGTKTPYAQELADQIEQANEADAPITVT